MRPERDRAVAERRTLIVTADCGSTNIVEIADARAGTFGDSVVRAAFPNSLANVFLPPLLAASLGGLLTTWVTFTPCFLWIFLGAPFVERLRHNKALAGALAAITAVRPGAPFDIGTSRTTSVRWCGLSGPSRDE